MGDRGLRDQNWLCIDVLSYFRPRVELFLQLSLSFPLYLDSLGFVSCIFPCFTFLFLLPIEFVYYIYNTGAPGKNQQKPRIELVRYCDVSRCPFAAEQVMHAGAQLWSSAIADPFQGCVCVEDGERMGQGGMMLPTFANLLWVMWFFWSLLQALTQWCKKPSHDFWKASKRLTCAMGYILMGSALNCKSRNLKLSS